MGELEKQSKQELYDRAAELRLSGSTYTAIARDLGVAPVTARRYVQQKLDQIATPDHVEQLRNEHYAKYMDIIEKHYPKVEKSESATYLVLRTMKHIEDLFGMKAPHRIDIRTQDLTPKESEDIDKELQDWLQKIDDRQQEALQDDIIEGEIIEPPHD